MSSSVGSRMAAIVCSHVARGAPILCAFRSEALGDDDSGWQFLCGAQIEDEGGAQIWAVEEVLRVEETLGELLDYPVGTVLKRQSGKEEWEVSHSM